MNNFPDFDQTDNIGGCVSFQFIPFEDVASINIIDSTKKSITLKAGKSWFTGYATQQTLKYTEKQKHTENGIYYDKSIVGFVPKDTEDILELFSEMENQFFIIRYIDSNGQEKVAGTIDEPLKFTSDFDTGNDTSSRNGHFFTFEAESTEKAFYYYAEGIYATGYVIIVEGDVDESCYGAIVYNAGVDAIVGGGGINFTWTDSDQSIQIQSQCNAHAANGFNTFVVTMESIDGKRNYTINFTAPGYYEYNGIYTEFLPIPPDDGTVSTGSYMSGGIDAIP